MRPQHLLPLGICLLAACALTPTRSLWERFTSPTTNPPQVYGSYMAGCLDGAAALPPEGTGYTLAHRERGRFYGHPSLLSYLQHLAAHIHKDTGKTLIISDLTSPRGGPFLIDGGHSSHQTGLDADIWFRPKEGADTAPLSMVTEDGIRLSAAWDDPYHTQLLKAAASPPEVERLFVTPAVKARLCETHAGEAWLAKIRPWWGHRDHLHVRLRCPADSPLCKAQDSPGEGDGCDKTLAWWFTDEARQEAQKRRATPYVAPLLPPQCDAVRHWPQK